MERFQPSFIEHLKRAAQSYNGWQIKEERDVWAISQLGHPEKPAVPFEEWVGSPEASRLKLRLIMRGQMGSAGSLAIDLSNLIKEDPNRNIIQDELVRILRAESPLERTGAGARAAELSQIGDLLYQKGTEMDKNLADAILYHLEKFADDATYATTDLNLLIKALPLEEPETAKVVQKLIANRKIALRRVEDLESIAQRMPSYSKEFRDHLLGTASEAYKFGLLAKEKKADCDGAFAALSR